MRRWALLCLALAIVGALLGFTGLIGPASSIAKAFCFIGLFLFVALIVTSGLRKRAARH